MSPSNFTDREVDCIGEAWIAFKRAFQASFGPSISTPWEKMSDPERDVVRHLIRLALDGATPRQIHEAWCLEAKERAKVTGLLQSWEQLNARAQHKDRAFVALVQAMASAFRATGPGTED